MTFRDESKVGNVKFFEIETLHPAIWSKYEVSYVSTPVTVYECEKCSVMVINREKHVIYTHGGI